MVLGFRGTGTRPRARRQVTRDRCIRLLDNIRLLDKKNYYCRKNEFEGPLMCFLANVPCANHAQEKCTDRLGSVLGQFGDRFRLIDATNRQNTTRWADCIDSFAKTLLGRDAGYEAWTALAQGRDGWQRLEGDFAMAVVR